MIEDAKGPESGRVAMHSKARHFFMMGGAAIALAALTSSGAAQGAAKPTPSRLECFRDSDVSSWVAPDPRTLYLRVNTNQYYRVDLTRECSPLREHGARLITRSFGSDLICSPLDLDLRVSEGPGVFPQTCIVQGITRLTAAEAAALPREDKKP
jgi:hypothetical protein